MTASRKKTEHLTDGELKRLRPAREVLPEIVTAHRQGVRGPQKTPKKVPLSIRLSPDVVAHFKSTGPGWQQRMDHALRDAIAKKRA